MNKRLITILATLLCVAACAFGLVACNNTVAVESVTLDKTSVTLQVGGEETLTATVTPDNATDKAVTWSSDNTAVATVANGKVTAVSAGTATVTATAGGKSATCAVTVETVKTVTSEQWKQAMESADKFVIEMKQGEMPSAIKIDGDKRMQVAGNAMSLRVKETVDDETVYFEYYTNGNEWVKQVIDESDYSQTVMYAEIPTYFKDDFSSLSYADGKYTAATLDKTSSPFVSVLSDVEITFEDGALTGMKFVVEGMSVEIKEIGATNITVPTEYIDKTVHVTEVREEIWAKTMSETKNFSLTVPGSNGIIKYVFDGDLNMQTNGETAHIFEKVNYNYYEYSNVNGSWEKKRTYSMGGSIMDYYSKVLTQFVDCYDSFEYINGKYRADYVDTLKVYNVVVKFDNNTLTSISFTDESGSSTANIFDVNKSMIVLPSDYNDLTTSA